MMPLRFHWRLPLAGEEPAGGAASVPGASAALPDLPAHAAFCRLAEKSGIDSLLTACGYYMPDPAPVIAALGPSTETIRFLLAFRPGLMSPTAFVQQVNTLSVLCGGRISLNVVAGHSAPEQRSYGDLLDHDQRYRRADEFLTICRAFWRRDGEGGEVNFEGEYFRVQGGRLGTPFVGGRRAPEIYLGGGSPLAREVAAKHADCWLRLGDAPEKLRPEIEPLLEQGIEVGVRLSIVARPTREEAVRAAHSLVETGNAAWVRQVFAKGSDSSSHREALERDSHWPAPYLWTGAVSRRGVSAVCLVGTPEEIADAVFEYRAVGVTQFILSGWPNTEALEYFGREILPRIRSREGGSREGKEAACTPRPS